MAIMTFGKRLSKIRMEVGLSQSDLSSRLHISKSTVSMYEVDKREPSFEIVERISRIFNVSTDYLILGKESIPDGLTLDQFNFLKWIENKMGVKMLHEFNQLLDRQKNDVIEGFEMMWKLEERRRTREKEF